MDPLRSRCQNKIKVQEINWREGGRLIVCEGKKAREVRESLQPSDRDVGLTFAKRKGRRDWAGRASDRSTVLGNWSGRQ